MKLAAPPSEQQEYRTAEYAIDGCMSLCAPENRKKDYAMWHQVDGKPDAQRVCYMILIASSCPAALVLSQGIVTATT